MHLFAEGVLIIIYTVLRACLTKLLGKFSKTAYHAMLSVFDIQC